MRRLPLLVLVPLLAVLTLVAGCAARGSSGTSGPSGSPVASFSTASSEPFGVVAARWSSPGTLAVTVSAPAGGPLCSRHLRADVTDQDTRAVWVQVLLDSDPSCAGTQHLEVTTAVPALAGRQLVIDSSFAFHDVGGALAACDATFGCSAPPADHCDPAWIDIAARQGEMPPEIQHDVLGCTQEWLVMDVDAVVTGCQPVDGSPPPTGCAGSGRHVRWFLHFETRWTVVASSPVAGCAGVHATVAAFPTGLCRSLPAR